jgi:hypothetical protein
MPQKSPPEGRNAHERETLSLRFTLNQDTPTTLVAIGNHFHTRGSLSPINFSGPSFSCVSGNQWKGTGTEVAVFEAFSQPVLEKIKRRFLEGLSDAD